MGMLSLMIGILISKSPDQTFQSALKNSVVWGMGFLLSFGAEFMLLGTI
jgi:hypothetical protein